MQAKRHSCQRAQRATVLLAAAAQGCRLHAGLTLQLACVASAPSHVLAWTPVMASSDEPDGVLYAHYYSVCAQQCHVPHDCSIHTRKEPTMAGPTAVMQRTAALQTARSALCGCAAACCSDAVLGACAWAASSSPAAGNPC